MAGASVSESGTQSVVPHRTPTEDVSNPYFLASGDNPSIVLANPLLNGGNFHSWSRSMKIALGAKNKLKLISSISSVPAESDDDFLAWQRCDLMVQSWILNSCTREVAQCILYADSAANMWSLLEERFSQGNFPRIFELQKQIYATVQGNSNVTDYFNKLDSLWRELNQFNPVLMCKCGAMKGCSCAFLQNMLEREERNMSIKFLMSLNDVYAGIRGQILVMKPFPTLNQIFSFVLQDEMQRNSSAGATISTESAAMVTQGVSSSGDSQALYSSNGNKQGRGNGSKKENKVVCSHCGRDNHTIDRCYKLHGFPPGYRGRGRQPQGLSKGGGTPGQTKAYVTQSEGAPKADGAKSGPNVSQEQYKHLLSLIQNLAHSCNTPLTPLNNPQDSASGQSFDAEDWHC